MIMDRNEIIKFYAVAPSPKKYFNQQYSFMDYLQKEIYIKLKKMKCRKSKNHERNASFRYAIGFHEFEGIIYLHDGAYL